MTVFEVLSIFSTVVVIGGGITLLIYNIVRARNESKTVDTAARLAKSTIDKSDIEADNLITEEQRAELNRLYPELRAMQAEMTGLREQVRTLGKAADDSARAAAESARAAAESLAEVARYKEANQELVEIVIDNQSKLEQLRTLFERVVNHSNYELSEQEKAEFEATKPRDLPRSLLFISKNPIK